jgi:2-haloacid dehalogenase
LVSPCRLGADARRFKHRVAATPFARSAPVPLSATKGQIMAISTVVFDAYGTLFDVAAAARLAAVEPGQNQLASVWPKLAEDWRRKQLEYTWLRTITNQHADFAQVTADSLDWALEAQRLPDPSLRARLLALYDQLPAYPEAAATLSALRAAGFATGVLSNGTDRMLASAIAAAGLDGLFDAVLSVDAVGTFKPNSKVYDLVGQRFGCNPDQVLFVSSNGWDVAGAAGYGFATVWVNRAGLPQDRLANQPAFVRPDLTSITELAATL